MVDELVEELSIEVLAIELQRSQARVRLLSAHLDRVDPFWRHRINGWFDA